MPSYTTADIRNIAVLGHGGAGKTSLVEAMLVAGGALHSAGSIEKGSTVSDYTEEEREHGQSIFNSVVHCDYNGKRINIIDTPGASDFMTQGLASFNAADSALIVVNAQQGIEPLTRRMMDRAKDQKLCRFIVINKIDAENVDLPGLVDQVREIFGSECLPINLPSGGATGVVDVLNKAEGDVDFSSVEEAHTQIVDQIVEVDEALMEKYLESGEVSPEELVAPLTRALCEGHLVPILFTAAHSHSGGDAVGVQELMDIIVNVSPSPVAANRKTFTKGSGESAQEIAAEPDPLKPLLAMPFKIVNDRFGKMSIFRVMQGTLGKDTAVYVGDGRKPVKTSHVYTVQGGEHKEVDAAIAGDIAAVIKVEEISIDTPLHEEADADIKFNGVNFPLPMYGLAVTAKSRNDEGKIGDALSKLDEEDPGFKVGHDPTTKERVMNGNGEMHLRVILERLKAKYGVEVETKPPKIAYRETIQAKAEGHHRHKKQTGGAGQFGEVYLRVEPLERGSGLEFVNDIFGGAIPGQFIPAIEKGVRQMMEEGAIAGYPMQDIKVSVYDGKHHPVDSKEVAFVTAARRAFTDAVNKAKPALLEPIVDVEVTVPNANMGDITGDLSGKRGRIQGTDMLPGDMAVIKAQVPLSEMSTYQSQLKSVTGGQGSYTMEFSHYEAVPSNVQQTIVAAYKPKEEED